MAYEQNIRVCWAHTHEACRSKLGHELEQLRWRIEGIVRSKTPRQTFHMPSFKWHSPAEYAQAEIDFHHGALVRQYTLKQGAEPFFGFDVFGTLAYLSVTFNFAEEYKNQDARGAVAWMMMDLKTKFAGRKHLLVLMDGDEAPPARTIPPNPMMDELLAKLREQNG